MFFGAFPQVPGSVIRIAKVLVACNAMLQQSVKAVVLEENVSWTVITLIPHSVNKPVLTVPVISSAQQRTVKVHVWEVNVPTSNAPLVKSAHRPAGTTVPI